MIRRFGILETVWNPDQIAPMQYMYICQSIVLSKFDRHTQFHL